MKIRNKKSGTEEYGYKYDYNNALSVLKRIDREISILGGVSALLHWDRATAIPKKAVGERAEKNALISSIIHQKLISEEMKKAVFFLMKKENLRNLSFIDRKIAEKYSKRITKLQKIPLSHVEEFSKLASLSEHAWETAKEKKDFRIFMPYLKRIVEMKMKEAEYIDKKKHPYNIFLDDFEEGMTVEKLKKIFSGLKKELLEILEKIKLSENYSRQKSIFRKARFDIKKQEQLSTDIAQRILEDKERYVTAVSVHPFTTTISSNDVRITTAYRTDDPMFSFSATMHESGHALYELNFEKKLYFTILRDAPSLGLHESQSRFWENHVGLNSSFWKAYYRKFRKTFPSLSRISRNEFHRTINTVRPGLIRIRSDEVCYPLHIIIRFEIETALFEKKIKVEDLPKEWNRLYKEYLGVTPKHDSEGVLQDVHWSQGAFGYFPTYALGTMYAATIYNALKKAMEENVSTEGNKSSLKTINKIKNSKVKHASKKSKGRMNNTGKSFDESLETLDFEFIKGFLKEKIHRHGSAYLSEEIIKKASGKGLAKDDFIRYLKEKYYPLYGIKNYTV